MSIGPIDVPKWIRDNWPNYVIAIAVIVIVVLLSLAFVFSERSCRERGGRLVTETEWSFHYALNPATGDLEYFYGPLTTTECHLPE